MIMRENGPNDRLLRNLLGVAAALVLAGKSLVFGPFAAAIVFGLLMASGLTLFVVPALYLTFEDVNVRLGIRGRRRPALPPVRGPGAAG